MNKATALDNRIRGITKEDYERQEYEVSTMESEKLARLLEYIARGYIGDYNFTGTDEDFENHLLQMAMCRAIEIVKSVDIKGANNHENH